MGRTALQSEPLIVLPPEVGRAAAQLLRAYDYARDCQTEVWQFAISLFELSPTGITLLDLRWLLHRQYAHHARETTVPGELVRSFRRLPATSIPADACFVLTPEGAASLRGAIGYGSEGDAPLSSPAAPLDDCRTPAGASLDAFVPANDLHGTADAVPRLLPDWDPNLRELRYRGQLVKRFRVPASNQELVLCAFQEEHWPDWIDDPLHPIAEIEPKRRLQATIKSLNRNQIAPLLRFHVNQNGQIVSWEDAAGTE